MFWVHAGDAPRKPAAIVAASKASLIWASSGCIWVSVDLEAVRRCSRYVLS
jgi:hypothetical protein